MILLAKLAVLAFLCSAIIGAYTQAKEIWYWEGPFWEWKLPAIFIGVITGLAVCFLVECLIVGLVLSISFLLQ
jgi:hypothetical protein